MKAQASAPTIPPRDLDRLALSGLRFLRTLSTRPQLMQQMFDLGYTKSEHATGWRLYLAMIGYELGEVPVPVSPKASSPDNALLDFVNRDFPRAKAALRRIHPTCFDSLFVGERYKQLPSVTVQAFLDAYAAIKSDCSPSRKDFRQEDRRAVKMLQARRILDDTIEAKLRESIEVSNRFELPETMLVPSATEQVVQDAARQFKLWLTDWRTTASAGVCRRDHLVMLGVVRRRATQKAPKAQEQGVK
jgi:hypothetical protein